VLILVRVVRMYQETPNVFFSLGIFRYWLTSEGARRKLDVYLQHLASQVSDTLGVEMSVPWSGLSELAEQRLSGTYRFEIDTRFSFISPETVAALTAERPLRIHLPPVKTLRASQVPAVGRALHDLVETGLIAAVTHPDGASVAQWDALVSVLPERLRLTVENMDCQKMSFQRLTEITDLLRRYPRLNATFDICHWLELGRHIIDSELYLFASINRERVDTIHYSVPTSLASDYGDAAEAGERHFIAHGSGWETLRPLFKVFCGVRDIVIEGGVPFGATKLFEGELAELGLIDTTGSHPRRGDLSFNAVA
jgi:hypothetical protein